MYLDIALQIAIKFNELPTETKIVILQLSVVVFEIAYFFWLRKYFKEEEKRIREFYR